MQINVNAQADHPLFVWPLLLWKSESHFFLYFIEELLVSQRWPSILKRGVGAHLPLSHTHTTTQIF